MIRNFFFGLLFLNIIAVVIHAQVDQTGFIGIDCGIADGTNYTDSITRMQYTSDAGFVNSGVSRTVAPSYRTNSVLVQQFLTLRSFPEGTRNCYTLRPSNGRNNKYLIRARFLYGNYDRQNRLPEFDVHLGVEYWDTVEIDEEDDLIRFEMVHIPTSDYINVCFINTGRGTPFVSVIELRPLPDDIYQPTSGSLDYIRRWNLGSTGNIVRYADDIYDRMWTPREEDNTTISSTSSTIAPNRWNIPTEVMSTAITPQNASESLEFLWFANNTRRYYIYAHFAEVEVLTPNQTRSFNIYLNDELWYGPFSPRNLSSFTVYSTTAATCPLFCTLRITRTQNSTLPPSINALEVYQLMDYVVPETDENDFEGIMQTRSAYNITRNWQGDPCAPQGYVWQGVNCSYDSFNPPRIISLDLSSSRLTGSIALSINDLKALQSLDLSNNSLTGQVPDFLSQMTSLRVLRLNGNNFTGSIPAELIERSRNGLLTLSIDGLGNNNTNSSNPCQSNPCGRRRNNKSTPIVPIVASVVGGSLGLLALGLIFWWILKKRKTQQVVTRVDIEGNENNSSLEIKNKQFSYAEVLKITNNFKRVIGKGGFGTVYHGYDGATQVAVKMLSPSSIQGYKEFQAEVSLLMSVHHKNLTPLVGYCNEGTNMGIIYEYMANGNLEKHILDKNMYVIGWEERLQIAIDAAQGLEYLHHGCKPPIVHRDVKSTNILLTENFQAKLADFGLSRSFQIEGDTHVSTRVAGTPGYLDPEYYTSNRLTEKSDVYGFGIVLLEMVAGRPAIEKSQNSTHIVQWASSMLQKGDVKNIIDPRLREEFDVNSVWKVVELAMACASRMSTKRPTMNYVVMELKDCLAVEVANRTVSKDSVGLMTMNLESGMGPRAR